MDKNRLAIYSIQTFVYAAIMLSVTYIPRIAKDFGANWFEISIVVGSYNIAYFLSSMIFGRFADLYGRRKFIIIGMLVASVAFFLQYTSSNYDSLLIYRTLAGFTIGIYPAAVISLAHDFGLKMGKLSAWGALGWAIGSYSAGLIAIIYSLKTTFIASSIFFLIAFLISLGLRDSGVRIKSVPIFPVNVFKKNAHIYIPYLLRHLSATMIWTFWVLYIQSIGGDYFWQAATMGINSTTQFFVMLFYTDMGKAEKLIFSGLIFSSITFLSYAFINNVWLIIPVQILLALSWSFLYVGSLKFLTERNLEKATATGLLNSTIALSAALGPFVGGAVMSIFQSYQILMIFSFFISGIGLLIFVWRWGKEEKKGGRNEIDNV